MDSSRAGASARKVAHALARLSLAFVALLLAACSRPQLPQIPDLPGITDELQAIPEALQDRELPDLAGLELPGLDSLPSLTAPAGGILLSGPGERRLNPGERLPGTDISFTGIENGQAVFQIAGLRSARAMGDSLIYDGEWPGLPGSRYSLHFRIYLVGEDDVRTAGVHQLMVPSINPQMDATASGSAELHFLFTDAVNVGEPIIGTTLEYLGRYERGAQFLGWPQSQYPYRNTGDSIVWQGALRPEVGARFNLRLLTYGMEGARVGGAVTLLLPPG